MLKRWMTDAAYHNLVGQRARRLPCAEAGVVPAGVQPFDWQTLDRVLGTPHVDVLVVRRSELLAEPPPASAAQVRSLFARGAGIVVRRAEQHDPELAALADAFARELGGSAHIQLFATPRNTHGFGWHYDEEDVFILQTLGAKTYYFRHNTQPVVPGQPQFSRFAAETSPLMSCSLVARGLLYLPRHMWHAAKATEDSLSVSLGLR